MRSATIKLSFLALIVAALCGCSLIRHSSVVDFAVTTGSYTVSYKWSALYSETGFLESGGKYFCIFKGDDGYQDSSGYFHDYLFLDVPRSGTGAYGSADGITQVSFYDSAGNLYFAFSNQAESYANISVDGWTVDNVTGGFDGVLMNYPSYAYVGISGTFESFDSGKVKGIDEAAGVLEDLDRQSQNNVLKMRALELKP